MFKKSPLVMTRKDGIFLRRVQEKGRGVFCLHDIAAGEVIETTPALLLQGCGPPVGDYVFKAGDLSRALCLWENIADSEKTDALAMGVVSFCNHAPDPNAQVLRQEEQNTLFILLKATRDIPADSEICIDYGRMWLPLRNCLKK